MSKRTASVVIGAGFGDEGKGLMTDYLVRQAGAVLVCRFNGGAQAGHTVVDGNFRHVYHHIGSGHRAGAQTYLGSRFLVNPLMLLDEIAELAKTSSPANEIFAHPKASVTTFYDMTLNAAAELARGNNRHGSCGFGINETVTRSRAGYNMSISDLKNASHRLVAVMLRELAEDWVPVRARELGLAAQLDDPDSLLSATLNPDNYVKFARDLLDGAAMISILDPKKVGDGAMVFEGAQGLALDELLGEFPHVTRSLTGLPYAIEQAAELGLESLSPVYVTRCYTTRHGAGPLPNEGVTIALLPLYDATNIRNQWQGNIRYAPLDVVALRERILADYNRGKLLAHVLGVELAEPVIAVTCLDQIGAGAWFDVNGYMQFVEVKNIPTFIENEVGFKVRYISTGPEAKNISST